MTTILTLGNTWRFFCELVDWRTHIRRMNGGTILDAVFISNMRDEVDRKRYLGKWHPPKGHFNGPRYNLNGIKGLNRAMDCITEDLLASHGRKKAKEQFISATAWAQDNGATVILLAASTKRLFGDDGKTLKELFPNLLFTIGDNGTMLLLQNETFRALHKSGLTPENSRIAVLGPYGLLGEFMTKPLKAKGFNIIGAGPNVAGLRKVSNDYGIEVCQTFGAMGKVDAIVACTHSEKISLNAENVDLVRHTNKKLLVVDVAEPSNLRQPEYEKCRNIVIRQDAGNAYSPNLKYVLGAISYKMFRLTRGVTFGCFAEAISLASALNRGEDWIRDIDWFKVNDENMKIVEGLFQKDAFTIPSPRCFGRPVKSFNLAINEVVIKKPATEEVNDK
ncbi:MAG: hypothetical protein HY753_00025 [Nitrospirae bacterium]|nr:hypothetical protein [Nitrospirota bacterium]